MGRGYIKTMCLWREWARWAVVAACMAVIMPAIANAQSSCHKILPPQIPPEGYGAPYNTHSAGRELLLKADCAGSTAHLTVGDKQATTYVYHQGYRWDGGAWRGLNFNCSQQQASDAWCIGEATGSMPSVDNWYVAYTCHWNGSQWRCGCRDAACAAGHWQVQKVVREETPVAPIATIAEQLQIPWDIAFLPDGDMLVTERGGRLLHFKKDGSRSAIPIDRVEPTGEGGLLGIVLHPNFSANRLLYLYLTAQKSGGGLENRVERYRWTGSGLSFDRLILDRIPGAKYHDGGRIRFGPDGKLYVTVGDASNPDLAQNRNSLAGKILRLNEDGGIPSDNPFGTAIYSWGHRNPQGITWDEKGRLWGTEHGQTMHDELNLIIAGGNYGWPVIEGDEQRSGMITPAAHAGSSETWAPSGAQYWGGSIFFGGLRGEALYEAVLDGVRVREVKKHFHQQFGRIRSVGLGPDGMFYMITSNRDGRGTVRSGDDKMIRVDPRMFR